jgi:hypothetical protein
MMGTAAASNNVRQIPRQAPWNRYESEAVEGGDWIDAHRLTELGIFVTLSGGVDVGSH